MKSRSQICTGFANQMAPHLPHICITGTFEPCMQSKLQTFKVGNLAGSNPYV